uniref:Uncharacterized protein n=1 Tax=Eutreptiella gymnastica TaxID=73025 RepID=A0A7S1NA95_9EUGL|mmetsp:Transcript_145272/g.253499  ORF Transcript_145272/g.253499 Transcript_145272/m.253499 type:complete len:855 (+) Transcript_145272:129-2693(+)
MSSMSVRTVLTCSPSPCPSRAESEALLVASPSPAACGKQHVEQLNTALRDAAAAAAGCMTPLPHLPQSAPQPAVHQASQTDEVLVVPPVVASRDPDLYREGSLLAHWLSAGPAEAVLSLDCSEQEVEPRLRAWQERCAGLYADLEHTKNLLRTALEAAKQKDTRIQQLSKEKTDLERRQEVQAKDITYVKQTLHKDCVALRRQLYELKQDPSCDPTQIVSFLDVTLLGLQGVQVTDQVAAGLSEENDRLRKTLSDLKLEHEQQLAKLRAKVSINEGLKQGNRTRAELGVKNRFTAFRTAFWGMRRRLVEELATFNVCFTTALAEVGAISGQRPLRTGSLLPEFQAPNIDKGKVLEECLDHLLTQVVQMLAADAPQQWCAADDCPIRRFAFATQGSKVTELIEPGLRSMHLILDELRCFITTKTDQIARTKEETAAAAGQLAADATQQMQSQIEQQAAQLVAQEAQLRSKPGVLSCPVCSPPAGIPDPGRSDPLHVAPLPLPSKRLRVGGGGSISEPGRTTAAAPRADAPPSTPQRAAKHPLCPAAPAPSPRTGSLGQPLATLHPPDASGWQPPPTVGPPACKPGPTGPRGLSATPHRTTPVSAATSGTRPAAGHTPKPKPKVKASRPQTGAYRRPDPMTLLEDLPVGPLLSARDLGAVGAAAQESSVANAAAAEAQELVWLLAAGARASHQLARSPASIPGPGTCIDDWALTAADRKGSSDPGLEASPRKRPATCVARPRRAEPSTANGGQQSDASYYEGARQPPLTVLGLKPEGPDSPVPALWQDSVPVQRTPVMTAAGHSLTGLLKRAAAHASPPIVPQGSFEVLGESPAVRPLHIASLTPSLRGVSADSAL